MWIIHVSLLPFQRIGQTREVHIFRLVTESSVEENILLKARQKRNLDIVVMDKGNFSASQPSGSDVTGENNPGDAVKDVYTKGGILEILGVSAKEKVESTEDFKGESSDLTTEQIETTMASLEDADDANALKGVRKEAVEELKEFDESIEYKKDSDTEEDPAESTSKSDNISNPDKREAEELERQIAAWQDKVGLDTETIKSSLSPVEKYGLRFHEEFDPYLSSYALLEEQRRQEQEEKRQNEVDIDEIETLKAEEERRAFEEGDLLWTDPQPEDLLRHRNLYVREKARLAGQKRRRHLTGGNWEHRKDESNGYSYWYNEDTGEATWDKPRVLIEMDAYANAHENGWREVPEKLLVLVMSFLLPFPERTRCSSVCLTWRKAASSPSFVRHVYPVEQGAYTIEDEKLERNHYRTITDAMASSFPGDTIGKFGRNLEFASFVTQIGPIELADGHYWQNADLCITFPIRIIGDDNNPSNVVVELKGTIVAESPNVYIEGVTFRRPKLSACQTHMLRVKSGSFKLFHVTFYSGGFESDAILLEGSTSRGTWKKVSIRNGKNSITMSNKAKLSLSEVRSSSVTVNPAPYQYFHTFAIRLVAQCDITSQDQFAVVCKEKSTLEAAECLVSTEQGLGIKLTGASKLVLRNTRLLLGADPPISHDADSAVVCEGCTCREFDKPFPDGFVRDNV